MSVTLRVTTVESVTPRDSICARVERGMLAQVPCIYRAELVMVGLFRCLQSVKVISVMFGGTHALEEVDFVFGRTIAHAGPIVVDETIHKIHRRFNSFKDP